MASCKRPWTVAALDRCDYRKNCQTCDWDKTGLWLEGKPPYSQVGESWIDQADGIPATATEGEQRSLAKAIAEAIVQALIATGHIAR